eukprot:6968627-Pyramimonas_sp.AAC.1
MTKKPKCESEDLNSSPSLQGFHRQDFSLPRTNRDRVPELDELAMQDERDDLAQNRDVDFVNGGVRTREQHAPTSSSERARPSKAPRVGRSRSRGFDALGSPRPSSNRTAGSFAMRRGLLGRRAHVTDSGGGSMPGEGEQTGRSTSEA